VKTFYDLLEIARAASVEEVKRAYRRQIARYHPDKVQHLGREFQTLAVERAAELTEAYRVLSDERRRADYDKTLVAGAHSVPSTASAATEGAASSAAASGVFAQERAGRDEFVRQVTLGRFRQALASLGGEYDESHVRGFDIAWVPKSGLFGRGRGPRLLGRFVSRVDHAAVVEAWAHAGKWGLSSKDAICVFLIGASLAAPSELADAIAEQRRKRGGRVTLIPIDARDWGAHVPTDVPAVAKNLLARLKAGT
jgi:curved DNA-binding protein CbpA